LFLGFFKKSLINRLKANSFLKKKYILKNFKIEKEMSTSGDSPEFDIIKQEDTYHWQKIRFEHFNK